MSDIPVNTDFGGLQATFVNCTLKRSPEPSHTDGLLSITRHILEGVGVGVDAVRLVDHSIPPGVYPDMREHGWEVDDFPDLYRGSSRPRTSSSWRRRSGSATSRR